jgi:branched-chain amino acid transport system ATP-binding protein
MTADRLTTGRVLECHGLDAGYGGRAVVSQLDLTVAAGEVVALFGPNGAGKSTTLLTLAGVLPRVAGGVEILGRDRGESLAHLARRGLGVIPEGRSIFSALTVHENLVLGRGGLQRATDLFPELTEHLDRRAGLLSGGQQQMVVLARVLAAQPKLLLADELSLGLAPLIVHRLLRAIRDAVDSAGLGVLLVEQRIDEALSIADRVYVLDDGRIGLSATAAEIRRDPGKLSSLYLKSADSENGRARPGR